jgi:ADP-ribose pyrophosphatase YjhB (NUDIX family)
LNYPQWLEWAQKLQALAQSGLTYTENPFDRERYEAIREITVEMLAAGTNIDLNVVRDLIDAQAGYMTPKIDVRGVVFQENKILLVKELSDGMWTLPGGWVDVNEPPSEAAEREVREESGYKVKATKLLAIYDRNKHGHPPYIFHLYKLYFLCQLIGGEPGYSIETGGAEFFAEDHLPRLSIARTTPQVLERIFYHLHHPDLPTEFD